LSILFDCWKTLHGHRLENTRYTGDEANCVDQTSCVSYVHHHFYVQSYFNYRTVQSHDKEVARSFTVLDRSC